MNLTADGISADFSGINVALDTLKATAPSTELKTGFKYALYDLIELNRISGQTLYPMGWNGVEKLNTWAELAALDPTLLPVLQSFSTATEGRDVMLGQAGNDTLNGLGGDDVMVGGAGDDIVQVGDTGMAKTTNGAIRAVLLGRTKPEAANDLMPFAAYG